MYKLFTQIITTRLEKQLDENQPREQAGFRSKYSTTDHIYAINQLKEKYREYNKKKESKMCTLKSRKAYIRTAQ